MNTELFDKDTKEMSDKEYWEQYGKQKEDNDYSGWYGHDIFVDFHIVFRNMNGIVFESKEKDINCANLEEWFTAFKKMVRLVDETKSDSEGDGSGGYK